MFLKPIALAVLLLPVPCAAQTQSAPTTSEQHLRSAQQYLREKHTDLAITELEAATTLEPSNLDAQANLGVLLYFQGQMARAAGHLRPAVQAQPSLWKIQALLGLAEVRLNDQAHARIDLEAAFPHLKGEKVQAEVGNTLVEIYSTAGELDKAATAVQLLLEADPTNPKLLLTSYRLYSDLTTNAILTLAISAPHSAEMHQVMAHELIRHGDEAAAIANYREAIRIDPKLPGLYVELGSILYSSTDQKLQNEAESLFKAALDVSPLDEKAELMLGKATFRRGDMNAAFDADSRAVAMQPDDAEACTELAKLLLAGSELEPARKLLQHAIEIDPTNAIAHYRLSTLAREEKKYDEVRSELAAFKKNKEMKDKLQSLLNGMRMKLATNPEDEPGNTP